MLLQKQSFIDLWIDWLIDRLTDKIMSDYYSKDKDWRRQKAGHIILKKILTCFNGPQPSIHYHYWVSTIFKLQKRFGQDTKLDLQPSTAEMNGVMQGYTGP